MSFRLRMERRRPLSLHKKVSLPNEHINERAVSEEQLRNAKMDEIYKRRYMLGSQGDTKSVMIASTLTFPV